MNETNYIERYWRDATPQDAIKEPPMVARFRDRVDPKWTEVPLLLMGLCRASCVWSDTDGDTFDYCQVYDAPDPGEGWRLIDTENEKGELGDEFLNQSGVWLLECRHNGFEHGVPYRRRIEQPKPKYVPFTWEDREQLRGRWITWKHENGLMIESQIDHLNEHKDGGLWFKSHDAKWLLENAKFIDTGNPVGKEVVQ